VKPSSSVPPILRFGVFELDPRAEELRKKGMKIRLQGQPVEILVMLLEHPGEIISREELQKKLWPADTFVDFEQGLNNAIKRLRAALDDDAESPHFIETLPRRGYRFIASVEGSGLSTVPERGVTSSAQPSETVASRKFNGRAKILSYPLITAAAILLVAGTLFLIHNKSKAPALPRQRALTRLTFDDGLQFGATWSPDGRFIAYSSDRGGKFDIWVQQVSGGDPVQITKGPGDKSQPDWSPDGKYIAYRSEEGDGGLFIIPALGGAGLERPISSFGYYPRWSPDSSRLLFQSAEMIGASRFYVVGTDGETPRQVLTKFAAGPYENHPAISAAWHPDGQRISVWVWDNSDPVSLWTVAAEQGTAVKSQISPEILNQIRGVAAGFLGFSEWADDFKFSWAPSGKAIYFERTFRGLRNIWRMTVDPKTLQAIAIGRITTGSGLDTEFSLSPDGKKLAFTGETESIRAWMFPFDATRGQVTGSGRAVTTPGTVALRPVLSRDGKKLVFCGNRAGKWGLREVSLADGREVQIVPNDPYGVDRPQWSPDGTRLAYVRENPTNQESQLQLWSGETHNEEPLTTPSHLWRRPTGWSPDGKSLLMIQDNNDTGRVEIWQLQVAARPHAEGAARRIISNPEYDLDDGQYSPDARWIVFEGLRNQPQGLETTLYVMAATGGPWIRITDGQHLVFTPCWSPDGKTIYFVSGRSGFFNVWGIRFDPAKGNPVGLPFSVTALNSFSLMVPRHITGSIELSLTQDRLVLPLAQESGSIWVLDHVDQ
jgi:Tol biopolymer transport system component/DNA-binding winged helix-turn-helix (wHTH) protein